MPRQRGCVRRRRGARGLAGFLGLVDPVRGALALEEPMPRRRLVSFGLGGAGV
jgi:hypothetical protein